MMNILLLEDNKFDADLIIRSINNKIQNATINNVKSLSEALNLIKADFKFNIVLLDINLPDGNGLELLVEIRKKNLDVLSIVLTSVRDEEQAVIALKTGANDYFIKDSENFHKLPDILLHNLTEHQKEYKTAKYLDLLFLEHDLSIANLIIEHFKRHSPHLNITVCHTQEEALKKLPIKLSESYKYQALIIDYDVITLESLDFLKKIRQELKIVLPIIILTSKGNEQVAIQALKLGADEYIVKRDNYLIRLPSLIENAYKYYLIHRHKIALEKSEKRYRLLAENAGDVIFTLDHNLIFTFISPSVENLLGFIPEDLENKNIKHTLTNDSYNRLKSSFQTLIVNYSKFNTYSPTVIELEMLKKDNTNIWTEVKFSLLINKQNESYGILGVTRDISLRKKYEQDLIIAKERAEENDRLKSAFLGNMSHEIRTPMNGILGFVELLKSQELNSEKINLYVDAIEISGNRMLNTLNDLMDISKIEAGLIDIHFSKIELNNTLENQLVFFKPEANKKNIQLKCNLTNKNKPLFFYSDKIKLNAILTNIIKNAIKYTDKGSIEFGYSVKENTIEFYVKDTGIGIPKNAQQKIFDRFVQASQDYTQEREGSGLGLSIAKSYVQALGGKIWVDSKPGNGTIFYFSVPYIIKFRNNAKNIKIKNKSKN